MGTRRKQDTAADVWRTMAGFTLDVLQGGDHLAVLREHGLTPGHLKALSTLDPDEPRSMGAMADLLQCDASQITFLVDRLEETWIRRTTHAAERPPGEDDRPDARRTAVPGQGAGTGVPTSCLAPRAARRQSGSPASTAGPTPGSERRILERPRTAARLSTAMRQVPRSAFAIGLGGTRPARRSLPRSRDKAQTRGVATGSSDEAVLGAMRRGEITEEEYRQRVAVLRDRRG